MGAVTPLGNDLPTTWSRLLAGESGVDRIKAFDPSDVPRSDRGRGEGRLRPDRRGVAARSCASSTATSSSRSPPAKEAARGRRPERLRPRARRRRRRQLHRRLQRADAPVRRPARARARPGLADVPRQRPRRLGERPDRDRARASAGRTTRSSPPARPARTRSARARSSIRRGDADVDPRRRDRGLHPPADPRRLLHDARARGGQRRPADGRATLRRDPRGLRHGRGRRRHASSRSSRPPGRAARPIYAEVLGYGASNDAHHMLQPDPDSVGVVAMMRAALEPVRGLARPGRLHQRARDRDAAGRPRRDAGDQGGLRRPRLRAGHLLDEVDARAHVRRGRRDRGGRVRARDPRGRRSRRRSTTRTPIPTSTSTTSPTRRARPTIRVALSNAMGLGGHNGCVLLGRVD